MRVVRRGLSCDECGGTEFEKNDSGFYTCISCGVQRTVTHTANSSHSHSRPSVRCGRSSLRSCVVPC